jgi:ATP-dependent Lhr-like helicase
MSRRWLDPEAAAELGRLDPDAIARVKAEAWPEAANADELHDALLWLGFVTDEEVDRQPAWREWLAELAKQRRAARLGRGGGTIWIVAERLPQFQRLWPDAPLEPKIAAPAAVADRAWSPEDALIEIVRGRLEGLGPVAEADLAAPLGVARDEMAAALVALQTEGFAMRGRFTPGVDRDEWCERGLLARINRYTVKRLRAEIEPVAARDFLRFLLTWQHVDPDARMEGPHAVGTLIEQLEGFEAPAGAWESEILAARAGGYETGWLDDQCRSGRVTWTRLRPVAGRPNGSGRKPGPVRSTAIALLPRQHAAVWRKQVAKDGPAVPKARAQTVADHLRHHGASFFDDIVAGTGLLRTQVEDALAELVVLGLASSDSFGGLRALLVPSAERKPLAGQRRRHRTVAYGMEDAGRWTLTAPARAPDTADVEHVARVLLRRYGVVFWRLIEREAERLPPWRDLLRAFRRLESRGEIRGGRFVAGFTGEQFALPEAVGLLRETRRRKRSGSLVSISGADPLNLVGILTPGPRLPALTGNRLLYEDGLPIATLAGGEMLVLDESSATNVFDLRLALLGRLPAPAGRGSASSIPARRRPATARMPGSRRNPLARAV